jgi:hypothetical protein
MTARNEGLTGVITSIVDTQRWVLALGCPCAVQIAVHCASNLHMCTFFAQCTAICTAKSSYNDIYHILAREILRDVQDVQKFALIRMAVM